MRTLTLLLVVFLLGWVLGGRAGPRPVVAAGGPADFSDVIAAANPALVHVSTRTAAERRASSRDDGVGGGFVVRSDGVIVTSRHVVSGARRVLVTIPDRGTVDARIVGVDETTDVAVLKVALDGLPTVPLGSPDTLRLGAWVLAGGSPYALGNSWSVGIVSGLKRSQVGVNPRGFQEYIQTDAATNLGNSGGPLLDANGRAVGVMTAILSRTGGHQGVALAVPMDAAIRAVERILRGTGAPQRASLGVRVREQAAARGASGGLLVTGFDDPAWGAQSALQVGDVILASAGVPVHRPSDLQRLVWDLVPGDLVALTVQRGAQRHELRLRLR